MEQPSLEISCQQLSAMLQRDRESILLIDCREPHEHAVVHLEGARLVPLGAIPADSAEITRWEGPIVVYCHHGMRSAQAAAWLRENGAPQSQSLAGGVDAWAVEIDPTLARY